MKTTIYLIRHAEPLKLELNNLKNSDSVQVQNEKQLLSLKGEEQAIKLSKNNNIKYVDKVYSSKYVRAISTAKYIALENDVEIVIDERLGERKLGTENKPKEFWLDQMYNEDAKTLDGESQKEVKERMFDSIENILGNEKGKRIAVVTHAAAMTFLLMKWCKLEEAKLEGKKRNLSFNNKTVIDGSFNTPEVFELIFDNNTVCSIKRININEEE